MNLDSTDVINASFAGKSSWPDCADMSFRVPFVLHFYRNATMCAEPRRRSVAVRLVEIVLPNSASVRVAPLLAGQNTLGSWSERLDQDTELVRVLLPAAQIDFVLDLLENEFSAETGFRVMLFAVEATLPRPQKPPSPEEQENGKPQPAMVPIFGGRISREELYTELSNRAEASRVYILTVVLSTLVAIVGLLRDDTAAIIAAMVIAPLLGPSVALSLATTLADSVLAVRALRTCAVGMALAVAISFVGGLLLPIDPAAPAILARTRVGLGEVVLALAAGTAGGLAFTTAAPAALVGVMVAVALLPPLVTFGLLLGAGQPLAAAGALSLVLANFICVNLAGVVTFVAQDVRPRTWWESTRARKATRIALLVWLLLFLVVMFLHAELLARLAGVGSAR